MRRKKALITGITGQDGAYLARFLVDKGYEVIGAYRRNASGTPWRLKELEVDKDVELVEMEMTEITTILSVLAEYKPDEIYNLAAQSFVASSHLQPFYTGDVDGFGAARIFEAVRMLRFDTKIYQAGTSEMYGLVQAPMQSETTPFYPRSPYACAKVYAHWMAINYREAHGMFVANGILFNHESPLRGEVFVTKKITSTLARIAAGSDETLYLGNLDAKRDWGHAQDYVEGMWLILQQDEPQDFVLATGETRSVRDFVVAAAAALGIELDWIGKGVNEIAVSPEQRTRVVVAVDPKFYRPSEVELLLGDPSKAEEILGWARNFDFEDLVREMVEYDQNNLK